MGCNDAYAPDEEAKDTEEEEYVGMEGRTEVRTTGGDERSEATAAVESNGEVSGGAEGLGIALDELEFVRTTGGGIVLA